MRRSDLENVFFGLVSDQYRVTSPETAEYNCIAWAAGDVTRWWWPDALHLAFWPPGARREESVEAFVRMYELLGFAECETAELEPGFERIALFAVADRPKHAARQLPHGSWTSKLGKDVDIEHALPDIEGELYGQVVRIMKRPYSGGVR